MSEPRLESNQDVPGLRGHHLVCLQFFYGDTYPRDYIANLLRVNEAYSTIGARVVEGADDVCAVCENLGADGTCVRAPSGEAEMRHLDSLALQVLGVGIGDTLTRDGARRRLRPNLERWRDEACSTCEWRQTCCAAMDLMYGEKSRLLS